MFDRVLNRPVITNKFFSFQCVWCQELFKFLPVSPTQAAFTCSEPTMEKCVKLPKKCVKLPKKCVKLTKVKIKTLKNVIDFILVS